MSLNLSVMFNENELKDLINVEAGFNPFNGADWQSTLKDRESADGSLFLYSKRGIKTITMPFQIKNDIKNKLDKLEAILAVSEPKELIFGNLPDRYFMAYVDGTRSFTPDTNGYTGHGTITWVVPSGVAEAIEITSIPAEIDSETGILTATIDNDSSAEVYPVYRIKHKKENGYIGIVHAGGAFEMGNKEDDDTKPYTKAETILDTTDFSEFTRYTGLNPENSSKANNGTASVIQRFGRNCFHLATAGNSGAVFNGASYLFDFPTDETGHIGGKNVYCYFDAVFWAQLMGQTGQMQILFTDSDNKFVMGYDIYKYDAVGNTGNYSMYYGDGKGGVKTFKSGTFTTNHLNSDNPLNFPRGHMDIWKRGSKIRYYWFGEYSEANVPELVDVEITKCYINMYQYKNNSGDKQISFFDFRNVRIRNDDAQSIEDIINKYQPNDEIVIDCYYENTSIKINGLPRSTEYIDGSVFSSLPIGQTKIEFYFSDWIKELPDVTVEFRKRWG
ncbi:MAG: phage tail family protein [Streptococcaceae bacterium]|jgi:predicted phage tail component-like protein|nr:phage tail family protein [Streptococcaceae bacterium]MCH4177306.1 phage tail family protein [Streptococcaceae bacterium]